MSFRVDIGLGGGDLCLERIRRPVASQPPTHESVRRQDGSPIGDVTDRRSNVLVTSIPAEAGIEATPPLAPRVRHSSSDTAFACCRRCCCANVLDDVSVDATRRVAPRYRASPINTHDAECIVYLKPLVQHYQCCTLNYVRRHLSF